MSHRRYSILCAALLALSASRPVLAAEPTRAELQTRAAQALAAGDLGTAVQALEELRFKQQLSVPLRLDLARAYLRLGRTDEALAEVQTALGAAPANLAALRLRGEIAAATGDWTAARDAYAAVAKRDPRDAGVHLLLGQALQGLGDQAAAEAEFSRYAELNR